MTTRVPLSDRASLLRCGVAVALAGTCVVIALAPGLAAANQRSSASPAGGAAGSTARAAAVGDVPGHLFATPPWNSAGVTHLADLRGRPLLVEFWGTRCPPCVGTAVPALLRLQETFGDDLQVLFVEAQGAGRDGALSFAVSQRWLGGRALWTSEMPFDPPSRSLPTCALLDADGRVLLAGNPITLHKELERQIAEQIKLRREPPPGTHAALTMAWTEFGRDRFARAFELLEEARVERAGDEQVAAQATAAHASFRSALDARLARIDVRLTEGWFDDAAEELDVVVKGVKGLPEYEQRAALLRASAEDPARAPEREAARVFGRLRARFFDSGGDPEHAAELQRFAAQHEGTRISARALELVRLARPPR